MSERFELCQNVLRRLRRMFYPIVELRFAKDDRWRLMMASGAWATAIWMSFVLWRATSTGAVWDGGLRSV